MRYQFPRSKRETHDCIAPLSIQIEKKTPRKRNLALQLILNIAAYAALFVIMGGMNNIFMLLGMMVASTAAQVVLEVILSRKDGVKYHAYLKKVELQVDDYLKTYKRHTESVLVPASKLSGIITNRTPNLYCKLPSHKDFLTLNLGGGAADYPVTLTYPQMAYNEENTIRAFQEKMQKKLSSQKADILPFGFSLKEEKSLALVNKGLSEEEFMGVVNAAVMDIATFHSPEEVQLAFCFYPDISLGWCCYLPHVWHGNRRLIYCDTEPEYDFKRLLENAIADPSKHTVAVVDSDFTLDINLHAMFNTEKLPENLSVLFFSVDGVTPTRARGVLECTKQKRSLTGNYQNKALTLNSLSDEESHRLARALFNTELIDNHQVTAGTVPERVTFFELFDITRAQSLSRATDKESAEIQHVFPVPIGFGQNGTQTVLDLTNDGDGNHCLVTGTTGSGKSEFLLTYILSACARYSPAYFSFVTIDFKGGLMSAKLRDLPHCLGEFTNAHVSLREITRIAKLLESEIDYREALLQRHSCGGSLAQYHQLYQKGKVTVPVPRLLVVVDEAHVFFSEDPSAMHYITKIATVGRQLGIILLLSTQSQSGVIPSQVRTNINVCIDFYSEDALKSNQPRIKGRALIHSNCKSQYPCQVALSAVYDSNFAVLDYLSISGRSRLIAGEESRRQFDLIHDELLRRYSRPTGLTDVLTPNLDKLLPGPLTQKMLLDRFPQPNEAEPVLPLGLSDHIYLRNYRCFAYRPSRYNLLVYGAPRSGKTGFIKSLLSVTFDPDQGYTPDQLNAYIIAKNPQEYQNYAFPHVGNILPESQLYYFLLFLMRTINDRKALASGSYPHILAVMDDCYGPIADGTNGMLSTLFAAISAESVKYGISLILTTGIRPGFLQTGLQNFDARIALPMGHHYDYGSLLHLDAVKTLPELPGRCLVEVPDQCDVTLETQLVCPEAEDEIRCRATHYSRLWLGRPLPPTIPMIPEVVSLPADPTPRRLAIGYYEDRRICYWNMEDRRSYLVSYLSEPEATQFLRYALSALAQKDLDLLVLDNAQDRFMSLANLPRIRYFACNQKEQLADALEACLSGTPTRDTMLVALDFSGLLPHTEDVLHNRLETALINLIKSGTRRFCCLMAEFKDNINTFRVETYETKLCATLEGANSGLLLGGKPLDHPFGAAALPFKAQNAAINVGWGIHVSPTNTQTGTVKYALEVQPHDQ